MRWLLLLPVLTACSDSSGSPPAPPPPQSSVRVVVTVTTGPVVPSAGCRYTWRAVASDSTTPLVFWLGYRLPGSQSVNWYVNNRDFLGFTSVDLDYRAEGTGVHWKIIQNTGGVLTPGSFSQEASLGFVPCDFTWEGL